MYFLIPCRQINVSISSSVFIYEEEYVLLVKHVLVVNGACALYLVIVYGQLCIVQFIRYNYSQIFSM